MAVPFKFFNFYNALKLEKLVLPVTSVNPRRFPSAAQNSA
jgi:hypothetical protein